MATIIGIVLGLLGFLLCIGVMNACIAKSVTGKWPHQSTESKRIYNAMCRVGTNHD